MLATDLSDEDIGRMIWVPAPSNGGWHRICFEGIHRSAIGDERTNGGQPFWMVLKATPSPGLMYFHVAGGYLCGMLVRSNSEIWPVEVDWAVSADGEIVETGERAA